MPDRAGSSPPGRSGNGVDPEHFAASVLIMVLIVLGVILVPAMLDADESEKAVGLTGATSDELPSLVQSQSDAVGPPATVEHFDSVTAGEAALRDGAIDVLVVDGERLEWRREPDRQLQSVVTTAIQMMAVQQRASDAGISPDTLLAVVAPVPVQNVEAGAVAGRSQDDETAACHHDRCALHRHLHLREPCVDGSGRGEGQPCGRGAARRGARSQRSWLARYWHRPARTGPDRRDRAVALVRRGSAADTSTSRRCGALCSPGPWCGSCSATPSTPWSSVRWAARVPHRRTRQSAAGPVTAVLVAGSSSPSPPSGVPDTGLGPARVVRSCDGAAGHAQPHRHGRHRLVGALIVAV